MCIYIYAYISDPTTQETIMMQHLTIIDHLPHPPIMSQQHICNATILSGHPVLSFATKRTSCLKTQRSSIFFGLPDSSSASMGTTSRNATRKSGDKSPVHPGIPGVEATKIINWIAGKCGWMFNP